ncbi:hypothetical protein R3P38DRAFT_3516891, partial [Favolaschia claudopus]
LSSTTTIDDSVQQRLTTRLPSATPLAFHRLPLSRRHRLVPASIPTLTPTPPNNSKSLMYSVALPPRPPVLLSHYDYSLIQLSNSRPPPMHTTAKTNYSLRFVTLPAHPARALAFLPVCVPPARPLLRSSRLRLCVDLKTFRPHQDMGCRVGIENSSTGSLFPPDDGSPRPPHRLRHTTRSTDLAHPYSKPSAMPRLFPDSQHRILAFDIDATCLSPSRPCLRSRRVRLAWPTALMMPRPSEDEKIASFQLNDDDPDRNAFNQPTARLPTTSLAPSTSSLRSPFIHPAPASLHHVSIAVERKESYERIPQRLDMSADAHVTALNNSL